MNEKSFFLRFYAQFKSVVEGHAEEYRKMFPECIGYTIQPITNSVNVKLPPYSWELQVEFSSVEERDKAYRSVEGQDWYLARAHPKPGAKFVAQKPQSPTWKHK